MRVATPCASALAPRLPHPVAHAARRAPPGCTRAARSRLSAPAGRPGASRQHGSAGASRRTRRVALSAVGDDERAEGDAARLQPDDTSGAPPVPPAAWLADAALLQRLGEAKGPPEVLAALGEAASALGRSPAQGALLTPAECEQLLDTLVTLRRIPLALEVYEVMRAAAGDVTAAPSWRWPACGVGSSAALVLALARALAVPEALSIVQALRWRGAAGGSAASPSSSSISFGVVVRCPHCAASSSSGRVGEAAGAAVALALVQPQEGCKRTACATCCYDFELFSGTVRNTSSQALAAEDGPVAAAARAAAALLSGRTPAAAVHELDVVAPGGEARTFRVGTPGADVPAGVGQRVTVACAAPESLDSLAGAARSKRDRGLVGRLIPARPPRTAAGEPLEVTNHATEATTRLVRAPVAAGTGAVPAASNLMPSLLLLAAAGEGASALVDPALPALLLTGAAAATVVSAAANSLLLPRLAQLPPAALTLERMRQELLQQHAALCARAAAQADAAADDVRNLGRLWQLEAKMAIVGDPELYAARLQRVRAVRDTVSTRMGSRLALLARLARVAAMIEIEVELDSNVAAAELAGAAAGIADEIATLTEAADVAELTDAWRTNAAASDEVERLLREV